MLYSPIKWLGGKRSLVPTLLNKLPSSFGTYYEPFVGGGALFFSLANPHQAVIMDVNAELINLYTVIRDSVEELIVDLKQHKNTEEYFLHIRNLDLDKHFLKTPKVQRASRFIYLNKTCFNGVYRVNSDGHFNVPFGKYPNPNIVDDVNLRACSKHMQQTKILCCCFTNIKELVKEGDFVYFDPPYIPLSITSNFTTYAKDGFSLEHHLELKNLCDYLTSHNVKFLATNSHTNFTMELYSNYNIEVIQMHRFINSKQDTRTKVNEVLISNY